ncbi:MAG: hypothetical protein ABI130_11040 [Leifsonia sp.]
MSEVNDAITVVDVLNDVDLIGIGQIELGATRGLGGPASEQPEAEPSYRLTVTGRDDDRAFRIGLRADIKVGTGSITSEIEAEYEFRELCFSAVSEQSRIDFANDVAIMAILPFTRQSIADITVRVFGAPLLMPIVKRGELSFSVPNPVEASTS